MAQLEHEIAGLRSSPYRSLSEADVGKIANAALEVLEKSGTAIYVLDPDTGERRPSNTGDVALNARFVDLLENIHASTINVFPSEIENTDEIDVNHESRLPDEGRARIPDRFGAIRRELPA
jgi:trimethylamine:corrinoid methyltransferase-like protein